jgi:antitoxin FitA
MGGMAQFVVRDIEESVKRRLKQRAALHGRSMEEEVRSILRDAVKVSGRAAGGLGSRIAARFRERGLKGELPELRGQRPRPFGDAS